MYCFTLLQFLPTICDEYKIPDKFLIFYLETDIGDPQQFHLCVDLHLRG
jgi:hypothetical protein